MSREEVGRLFGEFVRIRNEKTRGIPGSGLGLSIVRKIVELSGGKVTVESEPDRGTTFTVRLHSAAPPPDDPVSLPGS
jgi:signal transduction histidine kinase